MRTMTIFNLAAMLGDYRPSTPGLVVRPQPVTHCKGRNARSQRVRSNRRK